MSEPVQPPAPMSSQVSNVHTDAFTNIAALKKQQWDLTNYTALTYAGLFAAKQLLKGAGDWRAILVISTFVVMAYALWLLYLSQKSLDKFRRRLAKINGRFFTSDELKHLDLSAQPKPFFHGCEFLLAFALFIIAGALLATTLLSR